MDAPLPWIDLHRHLEGAVRLETVVELARKHKVRLPGDNLDSLRPHLQVTEPQPGVLAFIAKIELVTWVLADLDACRRMAHECVLDAKQEGLDFLEVRFSPRFMALPHALDPAAVTAVVLEGLDEGSRVTGLPVGAIGVLSRTYGVEACREELDALLTRADRIIALDLAGDELNFPCALFIDHFQRARDAGWPVTVHAGEAAGPENVWSAIRDLGAVRIGHGVRAMEDPALVSHMAEHRIGIEANLTSNVQTTTVAGFAAHPVRRMLAAGIPVNLNTDDPTISGSITLRHEHEVAAVAAGMTADEIARTRAHAIDMAFVSHDVKQKWRGAEPDTVATLGGGS
jgi:adenosine deaminase